MITRPCDGQKLERRRNEMANDEKSGKQRGGISASMVEDEAAEKIKKRARDWGLIVNDQADRKPKPDDAKENDGKK